MTVRDVLRKAGSNDADSTEAESHSGNPAPVQSAIGISERLDMLDAFERHELGWFWATDADHRLIYLSQSAAARIDGGAALLRRPLTDLCQVTSADGEREGQRPLTFFLNSHSKFRDVAVRVGNPASEMWWLLSGRPHFDEKEEFAGFRGSARDISRQFASERDATRMAQFDDLTGLANRHRMDQRLASTLAAFRAGNRACALLMLDLDKFKQVNDSLGHPAGDELLRQVSQRLQRIVPPGAEIGRLGGDEFQIILPDEDDRGNLGELGGKIIQMLSQPYSLDGHRAVIGASIGIAIAPFDGQYAADLVKSADMALYASKRSGRGQFRFFASDLAKAAQRQRELSDLLCEALVSDELDMHYQPIVRGSDHRVVGFEALTRWYNDDLGPIEPKTFVAVAEEANLLNRLGEWSLQRACRDAAKWPGDICVAVNVSAQHFFSGSLLSAVREALSVTRLKPSRLELEITEGVFMGEAASVDRTFQELRKLGVRLALDDFGTGFSSLAYLRRAPFEKIKIDESFVRNCYEPGNPNAAIIAAIISLAAALGISTTAEGVEALDELKLVLDRGVTLIQGFIFSRPVPQAVVMDKLASGDFIYEPVGPLRHRAERRTLFRRIGVIHEDCRYQAVLRNLSKSGALIEGLLDVPVGTDLVLDFGEGQLAVATVRRSQDATQGVQFETPLVSNGASGLCTRHRVSPGELERAGKAASLSSSTVRGKRRFMQVDVAAGSSRAA